MNDGTTPDAGRAAVAELEVDGALARDLQERFVLHWGEMANAWGINRTMGQIHGLLYVSPEPLSMDEIMERLKISRGNASMNLRNLEDWGVIHRVHFTGDRREYFRALSDPWELFRTLVQERKRREMDPTVRSLRQFLQRAEAAPDADRALQVYRERVGNLLRLLDLLEAAFDRILPRDPEDLPRLLEVEVEGL
jgi:DNA-binding transcriptional regulator GbsR (MarR family)